MTTSVIEGIAAYKARKAEEEARREAAKKPRTLRFNLEKDGDSVVVRFGQEIDKDAKHYDEAVGVGFVNLEHVNGDDPKYGYKNTGNHTMGSQGACYPCERVTDTSVEWDVRKGWKIKEKFYVNVIAGAPREVVEKVNGQDRTVRYTTDIDQATGDGEVYLLAQSTFNGIYNQLVEVAVDDETLLENYFKITRTGNKFNDTKYTVTRLKKEIPAKAKDLSEFELVDIKADILNEVPYAQQAAFYARGMQQESAPAPADNSGAGTEDAW